MKIMLEIIKVMYENPVTTLVFIIGLSILVESFKGK